MNPPDRARERQTFPCNCEQDVHFADIHPKSEWHPYGTPQEGSHEARYVGSVCTDCARTHYKDLVNP